MSTEHSSQPTVLIVGAGIGGLMLGALLERADIPYAIFERTAEVKPLGKTSVTPLWFRHTILYYMHHNLKRILFFDSY